MIRLAGLRRAVAVPLVLAIAGCTSPYAQPEVERGASFLGVRDHLAAAPDDRVRLILTHGMCSGDARADGAIDDTNWVGRRATQIATALGATHEFKNAYTPDATYAAPGRDPLRQGVQRYDIDFAAPEGTVAATFLVWGRHVDAYRDALAFDNGRRTPQTPEQPVRASINADLRTELMNRCLVDAVVYLGRSGDPIRRDMRAALCDVFGGRFSEADPAGGADARPACTGAEGSGPPIVLIPESLGSTILFEAFLALDAGADAGVVAQRLASVRSIFLASNQLPLLMQGNTPQTVGVARSVRATGGGVLNDFVALLGAAQPRALRAQPRPIELVAITDPNDVLGYRIDDGMVGSNVALRNVLVSNAPTYFGTFANPIEAHRNTARPQVFDLVMNGSRGATQ